LQQVSYIAYLQITYVTQKRKADSIQLLLLEISDTSLITKMKYIAGLGDHRGKITLPAYLVVR
jgi:hypothetical protein